MFFFSEKKNILPNSYIPQKIMPGEMVSKENSLLSLNHVSQVNINTITIAKQ
jgi:hypothetical protein